MTAAARPAARVARRLAIGALLVAVALGVYTRPQASPAEVAAVSDVTAVSDVAAAVAPSASSVPGLPPELAAIRPADLDGDVPPPIAPAELWPAQ